MTWLRATVSALALAGGLVALGIAGAPVAAAQAPSAFNPADPEQKAYVDGNLFFLAYHEVGHLILDTALVDQDADRRSSEEAADDIATMVMIPDEDEADQDEDILAAILGWARSAATNEGVAASPHYPDDGERAARIACYLYGSNPNLYRPLEKIFPVSLESVDCQEEYQVLVGDMADWLGDALVTEDEKPGRAPDVRYEPAPPALAAARAYLMKTELLEAVASDISQFVDLSEDVSIVGMSCGRGAAEFRYTPGARMITACYEAVDWLMRDANDEEQDVAAGAQRAEDGSIGSGGSRVTQRPRVARGPRR